MTTSWALVALFAVHLGAFVTLGLRRRTWRYLPATMTFAALVALNALQALGVGSPQLHTVLRWAAYVGLGVSAATWAVRWRRRRLS